MIRNPLLGIPCFLLRLDRKALVNDQGLVLPTALVFLGVLALLGTTAMLTTTQDMKTAGNHKHSEQAFNHAQAGCEEARARLRANAAHPITDNHPTQTQWRAYIGTEGQTKNKGYVVSNALHERYDSLFAEFEFTVQIRHQTDAGGNIVYWGDTDGDGVNERNITTGENIYAVKSFGSSEGSNDVLEVEVARMPDVAVPAALYVEASSIVQGDTSFVFGYDACGGDDRPGLATPENPGAVTIQGNAQVKGKGGGEPNVFYNRTDMDYESLVDYLRKNADFTYLVDSAGHGVSTSPGPGDGWGSPVLGATLQDPSTCSARNIVHYDTGGTFVELSDGVSGCGILLIEGDLNIHDDFSWYGPVFVTGSVTFTGGGNKQITGSLIVGGSAVIGPAGGNASIVFCSSAIGGHTTDGPLRLLSWKEDL